MTSAISFISSSSPTRPKGPVYYLVKSFGSASANDLLDSISATSMISSSSPMRSSGPLYDPKDDLVSRTPIIDL